MIQGDEISESAKAVQESAKAAQEIAKVAQAGISASESLAGFVGRIIGEPVDEISGIVTDRLKAIRRRQQRLIEETDARIAAKNLQNFERVGPKLLFPIIDHASLENNDELQDRWAELIASAVDPAKSGKMRTAFVSILSQLEITDVHLLDRIYRGYLSSGVLGEALGTEVVEVHHWSIVNNEFPLDWDDYKIAVDNLIRVGCVAFYVSRANVASGEYSSHGQAYPTDGVGPSVTVAGLTDYKRLTLTTLGRNFVEACTPAMPYDDPSGSEA